MVAIGLLVNCNVLDVCGSKCGPILVVCNVVVGADIYTDTHACCHVAKRQTRACRSRQGILGLHLRARKSLGCG